MGTMAGKRLGSCVCPCCGHRMAPLAIHDHTLGCKMWVAKYGQPWPRFKFSARRELYEPTAMDGVDYIRCNLCATHGWDFRFSRMADHLKIHGISEGEYIAAYPGSKIRLESTLAKRKATVFECYGVLNVFQSPEIKTRIRDTNQIKYGRSTSRGDSCVEAKRSATNLERYGAENPFGSAEVKAKIRKKMLDKYGFSSPQQVPSIRCATLATNYAKYGVHYYFSTPEFSDKSRTTSLERYGVPHPMQSEEVKTRLRFVFLEKYGVTGPMSVPEFVEKCLSSRGRSLSQGKKTSPEKVVDAITGENVVYTGDWSYWVTWANGRRKNPDFVVLNEDQLARYKAGEQLSTLGITDVIEVNGDFWHTTLIGKTKEERTREFEEGYATIGVRCRVLWESDINTDGFGLLALLLVYASVLVLRA